MLTLLFYGVLWGIVAGGMMHYRLKNDTWCLQVSKPEDAEATWAFNHSKPIVFREKVKSNFRNKVNYYSENSSLCINKLTQEDSGIYTITVISEEIKTHTHRLQVQDAVPTPVLRMSSGWSNQSAEGCNVTDVMDVTANCSLQEEWLTSVCYQESCTVTHQSLQRYNITIVATHNTIVCIGSNHVSSSNVSASRQHREADLDEVQPQAQQPFSHVQILVTSFSIVLIVVILIIIIIITIFALKNPAGVKQPEEPTDPFAGVLDSSSVDLRDAAAAQASQDPEQSPTVDTVYSLVVATDCVANRAEAPRSPSVSHSEAGTGAETVYSLLQRSEAATS